MNSTIVLLKNRDEKTIADVYKEYRNGFLLFARRYDLDEAFILDIYQDSIIALCENAEKGHIDDLSVSLKTYLFSIGKYKIYAAIKDEQKKVAFADFENVQENWDNPFEDESDEDLLLLRQSFSQLGEKCREILKLFYYNEKKLDEITRIMKYENKDVAKSQKSRCMRQLKQLMQKHDE